MLQPSLGKDITILRELARQKMEIAALPVQQEKKRLWKRLNALRPERPMVRIDQLCWNEMEVDGELQLHTVHPVCRLYEEFLRREIYSFRHMPVDMVVEPYLEVPSLITGYRTGFVDWEGSFDFGLHVQEERSVTDKTNEIVGHHYIPQIRGEGDLEKIRYPRIIYLKEETEERLDFVRELFGDTMEIRLQGCLPALKLWDSIVQWCGVQESLLLMIDEPEFTHRMVARLLDAHLKGLDQLEQLGLLGNRQTLVHCSGAYTDELDNDKELTSAKDLWTFNLSQIFSAVSPAMHLEYEANYSRQWFSRFGLGYYGCCEPLHDRIGMIRSIPNIRKVSMSPWVKCEAGAEALGKDYVFSRKPNPVFFAADTYRPEEVRQELSSVVEICARTGTPLELIQKDISTVRYQPERLWQWAKIAMETVGG